MPYCPKCFSSDVEENSKAFHRVLQGVGIGIGFLTGHAHVAAHSAGMKYHKYECKKCGHEFD